MRGGVPAGSVPGGRTRPAGVPLPQGVAGLQPGGYGPGPTGTSWSACGSSRRSTAATAIPRTGRAPRRRAHLRRSARLLDRRTPGPAGRVSLSPGGEGDLAPGRWRAARDAAPERHRRGQPAVRRAVGAGRRGGVPPRPAFRARRGSADTAAAALYERWAGRRWARSSRGGGRARWYTCAVTPRLRRVSHSGLPPRRAWWAGRSPLPLSTGSRAGSGGRAARRRGARGPVVPWRRASRPRRQRGCVAPLSRARGAGITPLPSASPRSRATERGRDGGASSAVGAASLADSSAPRVSHWLTARRSAAGGGAPSPAKWRPRGGDGEGDVTSGR